MLTSKILLASAVALAVAGSILAFLSINAGAQDNSTEKLVSGHGPWVYKTEGDVLDPVRADGRLNAAAIDPARYLRSFSYGHTSIMENGTVLR